MSKKLTVSATLLFASWIPWHANAGIVDFSFTGPGVSGSIELTYGPGTDSTYPQAFEVTGISGTFTDTNNGLNIVNAPIGSLVPINHATPEVGNTAAPNDFSRFGPLTGLPMENNGFLTYDNLFWPNGAPATATDYTASGGIVDIYGLMFNIGNGQVVDFWSNGTFNPAVPFDYGVAVANSTMGLDYVAGAVNIDTPEPSALILLGSGLAGLALLRRRSSMQSK